MENSATNANTPTPTSTPTSRPAGLLHAGPEAGKATTAGAAEAGKATAALNATDATAEAKRRLGIAGHSPALNAAVERALQVAPIPLSVLVTGESGTGKEFFPKIIHQGSARRHAPYIAVNCGAIPEGTIDSELFGHEKGSFTGAIASRKGYFEEAHGGTLFLDEVAELPLTTQARLLRVLESGEYMRVGSSTVQRADVRIVAATNVDLTRAVAEGRFREDLYYRLSTVHIHVPPLRERGDDIELLARKFAADFAEAYRTAPLELTAGALLALRRHPWPGNVRQLKNVVEQMALFVQPEGGRGAARATAEDVARYAPPVTALPAMNGGEGGAGSAVGRHDYDRERELLFGMIMSLRREVDELRRRVDGEGAAGAPSRPTLALPPAAAVAAEHDTPYEEQEAAPQAPAQAPAPAVLALDRNERELIRQSLERNLGRRKAAAKELNISERTLYRKIKEYGLDEM